MTSHKSIKRILRRSAEEVKATWEIAKQTSVWDAAATFLAKIQIQIMNRNGFLEPPYVKNLLLKKHEVMLRYFENKFNEFYNNYDYTQESPANNPELRNKIWICWWQGLDNAPELVKRCVESVVRNAGNHEVIVITEDNYKDFVCIPPWVEEKFLKGIISRTHFSDILRLSLLAEHGGMWLDATFFCTEPVFDKYFQFPLWTIRRPEYRHGSVACGQFATYALGCSYENRWIFRTIRDSVLNYWNENNLLIDYLFLDYLFVLSQQNSKRIMRAFQQVEPNNPLCDDLCILLNQPYDHQEWIKLKKNTFLFKLTWKQAFSQENNGEPTFYGKLLEKTL